MNTENASRPGMRQDREKERFESDADPPPRTDPVKPGKIEKFFSQSKFLRIFTLFTPKINSVKIFSAKMCLDFRI